MRTMLQSYCIYKKIEILFLKKSTVKTRRFKLHPVFSSSNFGKKNFFKRNPKESLEKSSSSSTVHQT